MQAPRVQKGKEGESVGIGSTPYAVYARSIASIFCIRGSSGPNKQKKKREKRIRTLLLIVTFIESKGEE